tara:strand:- start:85086 stop:85607 length:522 start_codon:yes stop_codon:yes gene_type:complete
MGTLNTKATVSADIVFQQIDTDTNSVDNRQGSLAAKFSMSSGTGINQINAVYNVQNHVISGVGDTLHIDFSAASQPIVHSTFSIPFTYVKAMSIHNQATGLNESVFVRATGSNAFTEPFNGNSGDYKIQPKGSFLYSDSHSGAAVDGSNKNFQIVNNHASISTVTLVVVGVSG